MKSKTDISSNATASEVTAASGAAARAHDEKSTTRTHLLQLNINGTQRKIKSWLVFSDVKINFNLKKDVTPVFCKARSLPFSLKNKVENEIDRLVNSCILEHIVHANWAAPIVPVLKRMSTIFRATHGRSHPNPPACTTYQQVLKRVLQDGSPKRLLKDRAPAFTSPKFKSFLLNRSIHPLLTTSNNPQANGLCERLNATLTGKLRLLHLENPKIAWTKLVKRVTTIYNSTPHSITGFPPIYLMFGVLPPELSDHTTPYPDIDRARKIAHTRTQNKHIQYKNTYYQRHKQPHFEIGDLVLVKLYHHPNTGKLAPYFTGPYTILEIISPNVVRIDRPNQPLQRDTDTIHVNKLKLYTENIQYISPPAIKIHHVRHKHNYTFPFKHLTPELFPAEPLKFKPTNSEPFKHLDPTIFFPKNDLRNSPTRMPGHRKWSQFKQTDAFTRGMVIGLKRAGWSNRQIAADTHLGASTVHRRWRRWLEQGNVAIYRNVGATRVTSARVDRRILRQAVAAPQATCTAILQHVQDTLDHSISTRTISRRLVANGLHSCRPLRRLPLTPPNRRQRLEWCRARSTWMTEWHRVVFSDESRFCLSSDSRRVRVWRRRGERSNPAAIVERPTVRQRGIMVWGAIAYDSRSPLLRIQGVILNHGRPSVKETVEGTNLHIQGHPVDIKLDTGADVNILPERLIKEWPNMPLLETADCKIYTYTGQQIPVVGKCQLDCKTKYACRKVTFLIVNNSAVPILGLDECEKLNLVKRVETISDISVTLTGLLDKYKDVFKGNGHLSYMYDIKLSDKAEPKISPARRLPRALLQPVKEELFKMEEDGIIEKIEEPTVWAHPMVVVKKPSGKYRICIDPRELNKWVLREHYTLPAPENILAEIPKAKFYSVLDAKSAFWQVPLTDQELNFIKTLLTSPPVLRHFDPNEPLELFADASKDGLGAILMQKEKPLSYASASLTSPQKHYSQIEKELLALYFGCINNTIALAKGSIYWPGMNKEIEELINNCSICQQTSRENFKEPMLPHQAPEYPWQKVGIDIFQIESSKYLLIVDYFSKYPEIYQLQDMTTDTIIRRLKRTFSNFGIPETLVSDNGPPFFSKEFQNFTRTWNIVHVTSSPYHPQSNGMVERTVQTLKKLIKRCGEESTDPYLALLNLRNTPHNNLPSPAQILMSRKLRSIIPSKTSQFVPSMINNEAIQKQLVNNQVKMKNFYDRHTRPADQLSIKDRVWFRKDKRWIPGQLKNQANEPRSFYVKDQEGNEYRRNSIHIREDKRSDTTHTDWEKPLELNQEQTDLQDLEESPSRPTSSGQLSSPGSPENVTTTGPPGSCTNGSPGNLITTRSGRGTMTAQRYVDDVLRPVTLPYLQGVPNALYQQDNARPHTARISQQALQDVQMLPWPPYSPDLSPIEHVWDIIGRRLHALPQPRSEDELWQMVEREWRAIPQDAIRTLIDSLPRRVAACIAVR
ncbi:K02A2.6-like, partial [Cordylochernes scorpioides]